MRNSRSYALANREPVKVRGLAKRRQSSLIDLMLATWRRSDYFPSAFNSSPVLPSWRHLLASVFVKNRPNRRWFFPQAAKAGRE